MNFVYKISAFSLEQALPALELFREEIIQLHSGSTGPGGDAEDSIFSGNDLIQIVSASAPPETWSSVIVPFWES